MELYLLHDRDRDLHKIGLSVDPVRRQRQLQTGNGGLLGLVARYPTARASCIEASLHAYYSVSRKQGEWFDLEAGEARLFLERCAFFERYHQAAEQALLVD